MSLKLLLNAQYFPPEVTQARESEVKIDPLPARVIEYLSEFKRELTPKNTRHEISYAKLSRISTTCLAIP